MVKAFKYLGILILTVLISITVIYQYKKSFIYSDLEASGYFEHINEVQSIPQNVIEIYNDIFPETTESKYIPRYDCPCRSIMYIKYCTKSRINCYISSKIIRDEIGRESCVTIYLNNVDFTHNCIGIRKASQYYFNSDLENLSKENITKLMLMTKNPSIYNPKRNPNKLNKIYKEFINDL